MFNRRKSEKRKNPDSMLQHSPASKKRKTNPEWSKISDGCSLTMQDKHSLLTGNSFGGISAFMYELDCVFSYRRMAE